LSGDRGQDVMALKTTRWDSARHLDTEEERTAYLEA
jgi:hypothetical protein